MTVEFLADVCPWTMTWGALDISEGNEVTGADQDTNMLLNSGLNTCYLICVYIKDSEEGYLWIRVKENFFLLVLY